MPTCAPAGDRQGGRLRPAGVSPHPSLGNLVLDTLGLHRPGIGDAALSAVIEPSCLTFGSVAVGLAVLCGLAVLGSLCPQVAGVVTAAAAVQLRVARRRTARSAPHLSAAGGVVGALIMSRHTIVDRLQHTLGVAAIICGALLAVVIGYPLLYPQLWPTLDLITVAGLPFAAVAAQTTLLQTLPNPALPNPAGRGSVFGVTIAAAGAAQLLSILTAGYLADQLTVDVLLADAPCYLLAGLVILHGRQRPSARRRHN